MLDFLPHLVCLVILHCHHCKLLVNLKSYLNFSCYDNFFYRSLINATFFSQAQTVALTIFSIAVGTLPCASSSFDALSIAGLAIHLLYVLLRFNVLHFSLPFLVAAD
jgi:hypothetical protein